MHDPSGKTVGVEIRSGRPWFAVCCASCLLLLLFVIVALGTVFHAWQPPVKNFLDGMFGK